MLFLIFIFPNLFFHHIKKFNEHFYFFFHFPRSNCPKCGSTGEAENASYRYKLSIKVAESNKLFAVTVFGSCLDTFFGLAATDLHR